MAVLWACSINNGVVWGREITTDGIGTGFLCIFTCMKFLAWHFITIRGFQMIWITITRKKIKDRDVSLFNLEKELNEFIN